MLSMPRRRPECGGTLPPFCAQRFNEEALVFQEKMLARSGLGQRTYVPAGEQPGASLCHLLLLLAPWGGILAMRAAMPQVPSEPMAMASATGSGRAWPLPPPEGCILCVPPPPPFLRCRNALAAAND